MSVKIIWCVDGYKCHLSVCKDCFDIEDTAIPTPMAFQGRASTPPKCYLSQKTAEITKLNAKAQINSKCHNFPDLRLIDTQARKSNKKKKGCKNKNK